MPFLGLHVAYPCLQCIRRHRRRRSEVLEGGPLQLHQDCSLNRRQDVRRLVRRIPGSLRSGPGASAPTGGRAIAIRCCCWRRSWTPTASAVGSAVPPTERPSVRPEATAATANEPDAGSPADPQTGRVKARRKNWPCSPRSGAFRVLVIGDIQRNRLEASQADVDVCCRFEAVGIQVADRPGKLANG